MTLNEMTNEEINIVDHWLEMVDPEGEWEIEFHPVEGWDEIEMKLYYIVVDGIVPYLCFAETFEELLDGLEANGMRNSVNLDDTKVITFSYWESSFIS